jgi:DNA polymerase III epsilon subunit-like protein
VRAAAASDFASPEFEGGGTLQTGIASLPLAETPVAVVDLETTGLYAGGDRVVEVAVIRVDPGVAPTLILDTLVNPRRPVSATEIHGITDADVVDAPTFEELAGNFVSATREAVFASYNVYFDSRFVQAELGTCRFERFPPYICLMYLRPLLGLGRRCSLGDACIAHGISRSHTHAAAADGLAAARLWQFCIASLATTGVRTFSDLAKLKSYKFMDSFSARPFTENDCRGLRTTERLKPRRLSVPSEGRADTRVARHELLGEYWDSLTAALSDFGVTDDEVADLRIKQARLLITEDELRWMHARAFAGLLATVCQDKAVTVDEVWALRSVTKALRELGWAPGDVVTQLGGTAVV